MFLNKGFHNKKNKIFQELFITSNDVKPHNKRKYKKKIYITLNDIQYLKNQMEGK